MKRYLAFFLSSFFPFLMYAQGEVDEQVSCGTHLRHDHLMRTDGAYRANFLLHTKQLDSILAAGPDHRSVQADFTIPVVVHVIHLGEPVGTGSNIPDAQIIDAINGLNTRYANANGQGVDTDIQFCLATKAPNGCPTTGIVRVDGSGVANYTAEGIEIDGSCGANELAIKNLSRWSVLDYYNVWVVHDICGSYAGYAYYPNGGNLDGTVIGSVYMTSLGKTLAHELGHGLDIRHTFEGDGDGDDCPPNGNCASMGDLICDTPPHKRGDCGTTNPCTSEGTWFNSRYNWMSYCSTPVNEGRFTNGQRTRMHAAMNAWPREPLQDSDGCEAVDLPEIISDDDPMCEGEIRVLEAEPPGGDWVVLSGPGDVNGDELTATGQGTITIQYTTCSFDVTQQIEAFETPDPFFVSSDDPLCVGDSRLLSCEPQGGDFNLLSGPASLVGNTLVAEEPGEVEIEYVITVNGCSNNTFQEFQLVEAPMPEITSSNAPMCVNEERALTGVPGGGEFLVLSGPGSIAGNELTANGNGVIVIEYAVEDNDCIGLTTQSIVVSVAPAVSITSSNDTLCTSDSRLLTGQPAAGIFSVLSGPGMIHADILTPISSGAITIQYIVSQGGCAGVATQSIISQASPVVAFTTTDSLICIDQTLALSADPPGGTFSLVSGPGTLNGNVLSVTAAGDIVIGYAVTQNGCTGTINKTIEAIINPQVDFTMDTSSVCTGELRLLSAIPSGGIYDVIAGPAVIENNALVSSGQGEILIQYVFQVNGCTGVDTQRLVSYETPVPSLDFLDSTLCNQQSIALDGNPDGGLFEIMGGPGVIEANTLTAVDTGRIDFVYTVVENNCVGTIAGDILVTEQPVADVAVHDDVLTSERPAASLQWLRCDGGYVAIENATGPTYVVMESGEYSLAVAEGECVDTADCILVEITATNFTHANDAFRIYPNPVDRVLYVEYAGQASFISIILLDMQGQQITSLQYPALPKTGLNVDGFAAGVYLMRIEVDGIRSRYYTFCKL